MDDLPPQDLGAQMRTGGEAYVRNLAAAEAAVARGQFNLAKVLRALAHSQRAQALAAARLAPDVQDPALALRSSLAELTDHDPAPSGRPTTTVRARARDLAQRALDSLRTRGDVPETVVAQIVRGCYGCGNLVEGEGEEPCDVCGALGPEFEWFEPFYSRTPEHLGQRSPAEIVDILAGVPDAVAAAVADHDDATLRRKPSPDAWCTKEIVAHMLETELLFVRRVRAIAGHTGSGLASIATPVPPWELHEGKGYVDMPMGAILERWRATRAETVALVRGLTPEQWAGRGLNTEGTASVLDLGTWLANHDVGHLAQVRQLCAASASP